jgi:hypothetical protein
MEPSIESRKDKKLNISQKNFTVKLQRSLSV